MQCQVGLYFLSNSFLMYAAMSFSMLYFSRACGVAGRRQGGGRRSGHAELRAELSFGATGAAPLAWHKKIDAQADPRQHVATRTRRSER